MDTAKKNLELKTLNFTRKRLIGLIIGFLVIFIFAKIPTAEPLKPNAWLAVGALVAAVVWIIFGTFREYQAMFVMLCIIVFTKLAKFEVAFASFSGGAWWVLFGAFGIGVAAVECGFMKRVAVIMLEKLPATYIGQCFAYLISGILIAPLVPSTAAKGTIMAPLVRSTSDTMGFENHSKASTGIYLSMWTGYIVCALMYLTGSSVNVAITGALPEGYGITWMQWLKYLLPWGIGVAVLMMLYILKFYMPKGGATVSKEIIKQQKDDLGPWSQKEKFTFTLLLICLVLWATESLTGISSTLVTIMAFVILFAAGVVPPSSIKNIPWDPLFFVGAFLSLPTVFKDLGINAYLTGVLGPVVDPIMRNPVYMVIAIAVITYLIRLIFVSLAGTAVLVMLVFTPLALEYNIHPFVIGMITYMSTTTWTVPYQHTVSIASLGSAGHDWINQKDVLPASLVFMVINIIVLIVSIPYWKMFGLL